MIIIAVVVRSNAYVICYMSSFATFKLFSEVGRDHHGEKGGKTRRASLLSDDAFFTTVLFTKNIGLLIWL